MPGKREKMDTARVADMLPVVPPPAVRAFVYREHESELGNLCVYTRVSYSPSDEDGGPQWMEDPAPRRWAARCRCTGGACTWMAGLLDKKKDGMRGLAVLEGPDGQVYPGVPEGDAGGEFVQHCADGQKITCPDCGRELTVTPKADIKNGRTCQLLAANVERVGDYAGVVFWMFSRYFSPDGCAADKGEPFRAVVLDKDGRLKMFAWIGGTKWHHMADLGVDPEQTLYHSAEAVCSRKMGAVVLRSVPDLAGTTGEKTGLREYIQSGGDYPLMYLSAWRHMPAVENLVKCGWSRAVVTAIDAELSRVTHGGQRVSLVNGPTEELTLIADWGAGAQPRQLLHMTRQEARQGAEWNWNADAAMTWMQYTSDMDGGPLAGPGDAAEFNRYLTTYGLANLRQYGGGENNGLRRGKEDSLREIDRYLTRQCRVCGLKPDQAMSEFFDYREMLWRNRAEFAAEELWPNHLRRAHDAIAQTDFETRSRALDARFAEIFSRWKELEYSDGTFCVRLPRTQDDLNREGRTLRHCVAGYGTSHAKGRLILFVRHARRPERCWYTLNEDLTGTAPHRVQIHGYRNDLKRRVPDDVLAFVTAWEQSVLLPVFARDRAALKRVETL